MFPVIFYFIADVRTYAIKYPAAKYVGVAYANSSKVMIGYHQNTMVKPQYVFCTMVWLPWLYLYRGLTADHGILGLEII